NQVEVPLTQQVECLAPVPRKGNRVPLLLHAATEQKPVHRVVVDDQDRSRRSAGAVHDARSGSSGASASSSAAYSRSIRSTSSTAPSSSPFLARSSSSRQTSEKLMAPNVRPFDFSV